MGLFRADAPEECGIATLDANGLVTRFVEKPRRPESNLANAGIYVMRTDLIHAIPQKPLADFGFDIIPGLVGRMHGYPIPDYYIDIGTLERLAKARLEWPARKHRVR
jgi:mannose-1-phosphate guanylyltransferase